MSLVPVERAKPKQEARTRSGDTPRQMHMKRLNKLKQEQSSWRYHWQDLCEHIQPWRGRFLTSDRNKGIKRSSKILNSTPRRASRILASGMMTGITSPARPWYRLTTPDPDLAEYGAVRSWLHLVEERVRQAIARSNLYNCLHSVYADVGTPGTAALYIEEDRDESCRGYVFPIGSYYLANDARQVVNTMYRETGMTVAQLVEAFGLEACSPGVRDQWKRDERQNWVDVIHYVGARTKGEGGYAQRMPFASCWMEKTPSDPNWGFLRESGYEEFPVICPRWDIVGEDVYGTGTPGMDALGDVKALQQLEKRRLDLVDLTARPSLQGPANLRGASLVPGTYTALPLQPGAGQKVEPVITVHPQAIAAVKDAIGDHDSRINSMFYADLWLSLLDTSRQMTAREVAERHEEKLLQLGPTLTRLESELLDPLIDRVFGILLRAGDIPRPPPELEGVEMRVEYISILAQAQKLIATTGIERVAQFALSFAQVVPAALDKLNVDEMIDSYGDSVGIAPNLLHTDEEVAEMRAARDQAQQQKAQGEALMEATQGAKNLAGAQLTDDNALSRLMASMGAPPPGGTA